MISDKNAGAPSIISRRFCKYIYLIPGSEESVCTSLFDNDVLESLKWMTHLIVRNVIGTIWTLSDAVQPFLSHASLRVSFCPKDNGYPGFVYISAIIRGQSDSDN